MIVIGLIPWLITPLHRLRGFAVVALVRAVVLQAVVLQGVVQMGDGVVAAMRFGGHWPAIAVARH